MIVALKTVVRGLFWHRERVTMGTQQPFVLVICAGEFPRDVLSEVLGYCGGSMVWVEPGNEFALRPGEGTPDVILADEDARCLPAVVQRYRNVPLVLAVQPGHDRSPVMGSVFYRIAKPISYAQAVFGIERALLFRRIAVASWTDSSVDVADLLGGSEPMRRLYAAAEDVGRREGHVLITGERGTGKERLARLIHEHDVRRGGPVNFVDCRVVRESSCETDLFGPLVERMGKSGRKILGASLFLGEIGTLSPSIQGKLLTALAERSVELAEDGEVDLDVRVIASSGDPLEKLTEDGRFLRELLWLLSGHQLRIPPLRHRKEDVIFLARRVLARIAQGPMVQAPRLPPATEVVLLSYGWPGNVRELQTVVAHQAVLKGRVISPGDLDLPAPSDEAARDAALRVLTMNPDIRGVEGAGGQVEPAALRGMTSARNT